MRDSELRQYTADWLQIERPQPMYDSIINSVYDTTIKEEKIYSIDLVSKFKDEFKKFASSHTLNDIVGLDTFNHIDVCIGCTQFIDDIYQRIGNENIMIFEGDYKYHWRLNNDIVFTTLETLKPGKELLMSAPFPSLGDIHPEMNVILDKCLELNIPVHLDCAWLFCCRDISFDFSHPAIHSVGISLSKAGLGSDRIGIRFSRARPNGAITIMNDFNMNCRSLMHLGIKFMQIVGPDYFWKKYGDVYYQVCRDFDLIPTKAIHVAKTKEGNIVGVRPLLRAKYNAQNPKISQNKMHNPHNA